MLDKRTVSVVKLYRDCLRLADFLGSKQGNRGALRHQVRTSFRANVGETNQEKILDQRQAAIRALSNFMFHEAQKFAQEQQDKEDEQNG